MEADIETQPLLRSREASIRYGSSQRRNRRIGIASVIIIFLLLVGVICKVLPSSRSIVDDAMQVSNMRITKVHLDGWNPEGNAFQLSTNLDFWVDYEGWNAQNGSQSLPPWQKRLGRFTSEKVLRTACFTLDNVTNYDENESLAYVSIKEPICIDLRQDEVTPLRLTILVEPRIKNIVKVIKRLLLRQDGELLLSSKLDITLQKRIGGVHLSLGKFRNLRVNWDQIQMVHSSLRRIITSLGELLDKLKGIEVRDFAATDSDNGFSVDIVTEALPLPKGLDLVELPVNSQIPQIDWQVKLPDCDDEYTIDLPSLAFSSDSITVDDPLTLSASMDIKGPLPEKFLSQVCWSDGENAATPFTNFLNKLLNASELINVKALGHPTHKLHGDTNENKSLVPYRVLEELLQELSFVPLAANMTLDSQHSLQRVTIDGLRIKWAKGDNRLVVSGKIVAYVGLPFYETNGQYISVGHVKGITKLYHNDIHFLTVPMGVWTPSSSKILRDKENLTLLRLLLNIHDDEVQIADSMELTKVLNEVLMKGHAEVGLSTKLDLLVTTPLGQLVLLGLKGQGTAIVRS